MRTPRHNLVYDEMSLKPEFGFMTRHDYGCVLDSVYEMTDAVATANGITHEKAIEQVMRDECWPIKPSHVKMIINQLKGT